ncbi:hypothetical protein GR702_02750 [Novosphingobium sp. FGD1]|uniref:Uncharacterized protein n=1 Tax=Novosphingobium silvae TaxID=2692619 RepID=A0A7X4K599_9SPHN|nr:hypothetical protein [Novosphingobium silvae]MYL96696.1 hypothetical protein [Novosphingobium silvae]
MTSDEGMRNRPKVMHLFSRLLLAGIGCNVAAILLYHDRFRAEAVAAGQSGAAWLLSIVFVVTLFGFLWWRIARRAGNLARWLFIALSVTSLWEIGKFYRLGLKYGWFYGVLMVCSYLLVAACSAILVRRDVSRWLRSRARTGEIDPDVFA